MCFTRLLATQARSLNTGCLNFLLVWALVYMCRERQTDKQTERREPDRQSERQSLYLMLFTHGPDQGVLITRA